MFNLKEIESLVTTRVLCDRLVDKWSYAFRYKFKYNEALTQAMYALDDILIERNLNKLFWARIRGNRLYLFYLPLKRIAMEVGVVTDESDKNYRHRFRIEFVGYRGKILPATSDELVNILIKSSQKRKQFKRGKD